MCGPVVVVSRRQHVRHTRRCCALSHRPRKGLVWRVDQRFVDARDEVHERCLRLVRINQARPFNPDLVPRELDPFLWGHRSKLLLHNLIAVQLELMMFLAPKKTYTWFVVPCPICFKGA
jgi:hypothetical protein